MAFPLFTTTPTSILRLGLGLGVGFSAAAAFYPSSPFRAAPMQCQYTAPYSRPDTQTSPESGWAVDSNNPILRKQGETSTGAYTSNSNSRFLNARTMRQVSLGSVLGLVAGVGLRAFSRVLVVLLGMGVVLVEVCFSFLFLSFLFLLSWFPFVKGVLSCHRLCRN